MPDGEATRGRGGRGGRARGVRGNRGDRGDRGSRGGERGDRGGRGGDYTPRGRGRGDGFGRDRGGDRGSFRGGFSGTRGSGARGRGEGRGGGRGGRREASPGRSQAFSYEGTIPEPDPQVTSLEDEVVSREPADDLAREMGKLQLKPKTPIRPSPAFSNDRLPCRPAFGSKGRNVVVWANYFSVQVRVPVLYRYTMEVARVPTDGKASDRAVRGKKLQLVIQIALLELQKLNPDMVAATEFKSQLIVKEVLNIDLNPLRVAVPVESSPDKADAFAITLNGPYELDVTKLLGYVGTMRDNPNEHAFPRFPELVDALNIICGYGPKSKFGDVTVVGRSRFFPFGEECYTADLFVGNRPLVAARGFFQSMRLGTSRLLLNANVTHGIFRAAGSLSKIFDDLGVQAVKREDRNKWRVKNVLSHLSKARILVNARTAEGKEYQRKKTIYGFAVPWDLSRDGKQRAQIDPAWEFGGPKNVKFNSSSGGANRFVTVFDHFKRTYGMQLRDYPLVNVGNRDKPTYYPAELIEIVPGQPVKAKLTGAETTAMLAFACRSPHTNAARISTNCRNVLSLDDVSLQRFGVQTSRQLLTIHARVLNVPTVRYQGNPKNSEIVPQSGSWNMRFVKVFKSGKMIDRWSYVNILMKPHHHSVDGQVVSHYGTFMKDNMGINIRVSPVEPDVEEMSLRDAHDGELERRFQWMKESGMQFGLFILSEKDTSGLYAKIKMLGDCIYGIHTSCVDGTKFGKGSPGYFANVALKWNLKGGGANHRLRDELSLVKDGKTMFVGYDVTHPTNMNVDKNNMPPSLVGMVSSVDKDLGQWPAIDWEQEAKQEMLDQRLTSAFKSRLELWQKANKKRLPENIVIFRDGVSEGQFSQVLDDELPMMREACRLKYPPNEQPKLTIVVSVKRHQSRFYPTDPNDMSGSGNVQPGTVVDRGVTQACYWDFFLTAHDALQGTARPAHYSVLLDEVFRAHYGVNAADELEKLTHELCYLFGRATKAVSICPPAYYADIVCERARAHRPEWFDVSDTESQSTAGVRGGTASPQVHEALRDTMYYI